MLYVDIYPGADIKPDEKEYKESIISIICDHFYHNNLKFILASSKTASLPYEDKTTVVFLSGNEQSIVPRYVNNVALIFTDFWLPTMPSNMREIPIGFNERSEGRFLSSNIDISNITSRYYDLCFIGSTHSLNNSHRTELLNQLDSLKNKYNIFTNSYTKFFYGCDNINQKKKQYKEILYNTKISLCPGGLYATGRDLVFPGWETYRFNESIRYGNIIICNYNWSKYYSGPNVFYIDTWKNLNNVFINNILSNDLNERQKLGLLHYKKHLSRFNIIHNLIQDIEKIL